MANSRYSTPGNSDAVGLYQELKRRIESLERRQAGSSAPVVVAAAAPFAAQAAPLGDNTKAAGVIWINPADNNAMSVFSPQGTWDPIGDMTVVGDNLAPNNAPVIKATGGFAVIHGRIVTPTVNPSPVTYIWHLGTTVGFTADVTTVVGMSSSSAITIKSLPNGSPLAYATNYYIKVFPSDVDGTGPVSNEDLVQLAQVSNPDVSAAYAYLGSLIVDQLIGGSLNADMLLAAMISNRPGGTGPGVDINTTGINLYDALGTLATSLQPDLSKFKGDGEFGSLTITGLAAFRSMMEIAQGAQVVLRESTTAPVAPPTPTIGWDSLTFNNFAGCYGLHWTGTEFSCIQSTGGNPIVKSSVSADLTLFTNSNNYPWGGVVKIGTNWYTLEYYEPGDQWYIDRYDSAGFFLSEISYTPIGTSFGSGGSKSGGLAPAAVGTDGTNLLVGEFDSANHRFRIQTRNPTTLAVTATNNTSTNGGFTGPVVGIIRGNFDYGATNTVILTKAATTFQVFDASLTYTDYFATPQPGSMSGVTWDGTRFWSTRAKSVSSNVLAYKHSTYTWLGSPAEKGHFATSWWRDTNAAGTGTHVTDMGPVASFTVKKRAQITLTSPLIPGSGGVDDANAVGFALGIVNSSRTNLWQQTLPADNVNTATYGDGIVFTGTNPSATNTFALTASPGIVKTSAVDAGSNPMFQVDGSGAIARGADVGGVLTQSLLAACSTNVDLTTTEVDITGATITFTTRRANARVLIFGSFYFSVLTANNNIGQGKCSIDGTVQTAFANYTGDNLVPNRGNSSQNWIATLASAGSHTIKLRGVMTAGSGYRVNAPHTTIAVIVFE